MLHCRTGNMLQYIITMKLGEKTGQCSQKKKKKHPERMSIE